MMPYSTPTHAAAQQDPISSARGHGSVLAARDPGVRGASSGVGGGLGIIGSVDVSCGVDGGGMVWGAACGAEQARQASLPKS